MNYLWRLSHKLYLISCRNKSEDLSQNQKNPIWRVGCRVVMGGVQRIARFVEILSYIIGSNAISCKCEIGNGTQFYHRGVGCVVHEKAVIGKNCKIFQNVTIGEKNNMKDEHGVPIIGDDVTIGAGAVILGGIKVGDNCIIGSNAVVVKDVNCDCIVMGIPAKEWRR